MNLLSINNNKSKNKCEIKLLAFTAYFIEQDVIVDGANGAGLVRSVFTVV